MGTAPRYVANEGLFKCLRHLRPRNALSSPKGTVPLGTAPCRGVMALRGHRQPGGYQSPLPPCSCPRQPLHGARQTRGKSGGKSTPRGNTEIAGQCLHGYQYPSTGTTCARSPLATHGAGRPKMLGFWITFVHRPQRSPQAPALPAALQPPAGRPPFLPHRPQAVTGFGRCSRPSCPARCAPDGSRAGNPTPRLGQWRGRKGPGMPDKPLLCCQSKASR